MSQIVPLEMLQESERGRVMELVGPDAERHRLQEIGLREGVTVRLVKPGQPCIVAIDGQRLSFRADPGTMVLVEVVGK